MRAASSAAALDRATSSSTPRPRPDGVSEGDLYAAEPAGADYLDRVGGLIRRYVPDVGAVRCLAGPPDLAEALDGTGTSAASSRAGRGPCDTVLVCGRDWPAAPTPFLGRCVAAARRAVVWVVAADDGKAALGPTLAGCLPLRWLADQRDGPMGVEVVLGALPNGPHPHFISGTAWTMELVVSDVGRMADEAARRLGWREPERREAVRAHFAGMARPDPLGWRLDVARRTAVIVWHL